MSSELKQTILNTVDDLVSDFLYYDRKEDEELSSEELSNSLKDGIITIDEIVEQFSTRLREGF